VGLYQCVGAVPRVFDVKTPTNLPDEYLTLVNVLEFSSDFGVDFVVPGAACFGSYQRRLLIGSLWPIVLLLVVAACLVGQELARTRWRRNSARISLGNSSAVCSGLRSALPLVLVTTFVLVPSVATRIFRSFLCDAVEYDPSDVRRYLRDDLDLSCDSQEHDATEWWAAVMLLIWPVGIPVLYLVLLYASRAALRSGIPTRLSRATAFLSGDYKTTHWWWEPLEMCRKLTVTGAIIEKLYPTAQLDTLLRIREGSAKIATRPVARLGLAYQRGLRAGPHSRRTSHEHHLPVAPPQHQPSPSFR
jgi:hypothetical protein